LLVVFLTTLMLLATIVAAPSVRTERKREQEEEMIWRGKQYIRAIKLYYRKNGKFPTSLDDLTKPKTGSLRFLRQAYKDPMNKEDGSWRLIYVGPAGQLIGSLKPPQTLQGGPGQIGTPAGALAGQGGTQGTNTSQSAFGSQGGGSAFGPQSGGSAFGPQNGGSAFGPQSGGSAFGSQPGTAQNGAAGTAGGDTMSNPTSLTPSDAEPSTIIGGNIIGIGSKIDRKSVIVYEKATNYHLFEFIWDPSKDVMGIGGNAGGQVGTPVPPGQGFGQGFGQAIGQPAQNPAGTQPGQNPAGSQPGPNLNNPTQGVPPLAPNSPQ
jgi:type II secretory pathway pseudopilin PulG